MFEITDEFLAQAGFTTLNDEQKVALKEQVTESVQNKIGDRIVSQIGEERSEELGALMDGNAEHARSVMASIDSSYQESDDFKAVQELGKANNATDDEIVKEFAILAWMKHNGINVAEVVQESMNEAMAELTVIYQQAVEAVNRQA